MYRALANLSTGKGIIEKGRAFPARRLAPSIADKLLTAGKICEVSAPPLSQMPEIQTYTRRLKKLSITMTDEFIDADPKELSSALGVTEAQIVALQDQLCRKLDAPGKGVRSG
jgi:hypothetical protein